MSNSHLFHSIKHSVVPCNHNNQGVPEFNISLSNDDEPIHLLEQAVPDDD